MTRSLRIAILTHSTNARGGVVHALQLGEALMQLGHTAAVHAPDPTGGGFFCKATVATVSVAASPVMDGVAAMIERRVADYVRLHVLNERLGARRSFRAAEACRGLNRCGGRVSADRPGGSTRVLHAVVPCHPEFVQTLLCALHDPAVSVAAPLLLSGDEHPCLL